MSIIGISSIISCIVSGIIYFSVKKLEQALNKNIMGYAVLLSLAVLIAFVGFMSLTEDDGCGGGAIVMFFLIVSVNLFMIFFYLIEKLYKKFKL